MTKLQLLPVSIAKEGPTRGQRPEVGTDLRGTAEIEAIGYDNGVVWHRGVEGGMNFQC